MAAVKEVETAELLQKSEKAEDISLGPWRDWAPLDYMFLRCCPPTLQKCGGDFGPSEQYLAGFHEFTGKIFPFCHGHPLQNGEA